MAQVWIREFDAKTLFFKYIWKSYHWVLINVEKSDYSWLKDNIKYVVKPDMLFWKRWKLGLVWVWLNKQKVIDFIEEKSSKEIEISNIKWKLDIFLVEEFEDLEETLYISFSQTRNGDIVRFSREWWIDVEESWDLVKEKNISALKDLEESDLKKIWIWEKEMTICKKLFDFYREFWFTYLEVNPLSITKSWEIHITDMVWKLDSCEIFRQKNNWWDIKFPKSFWKKITKKEEYIKELDSKTWASLKMDILNKDAKIWTLFAWWWWSLVLTDELWHMWYGDEIWNYWELSWAPDKDNTREFCKVLFDLMLESKAEEKYLLIWWAIANFTDIKTTFTWIKEALNLRIEEIQNQKIKVLVRRWWKNEKIWLKNLKDFLEKNNIENKIYSWKDYMTDFLKEINFNK